MSIRGNYPLVRFCIWPAGVIAGFYHHIAKNNYLIVEAEKDTVDSVFFLLKTTEKNVFKEPSDEIFDNYLPDVSDAIVVKTLPSEAPLVNKENIPVPSLEKIMVDLSAEKLFSFLKGNELVNVLRNAFNKYTINTGRLKRYAKRRNRDVFMRDIINRTENNHEQEEI